MTVNQSSSDLKGLNSDTFLIQVKAAKKLQKLSAKPSVREADFRRSQAV